MITPPIIPQVGQTLYAEFVKCDESGHCEDRLHLPVIAWDARGNALVAEVEVSSDGQLTPCKIFARSLSRFTGDTWKLNRLTGFPAP